MTRVDFIARVAADNDRIAQDALVSGFLRGREVDSIVHLVRDVADALNRNLRLSKRTQAHRLERLLRCLPLHESQLFLSLARVAREFSPHLRLTVANVIPDCARIEVYRPESTAPTPTTEKVPDDLPPVRGLALLSLADPERGHQGLGYSTVLLLSHPDHQDSNRKLLRNAGLDPMVVGTCDELREVLATSTEVCGCAIDQSVLTFLDANDQVDLFETLARYSSFVAIRVHDAPELLVSHERASKIIKKVRQLGTRVPRDAISFQTDRRIRAAELSFFSNAAQLLRAHESTSFVLGDLTSTEARLLVAAARARVRAEGLDTELDSKPITVRFLPGGRSGARLVTVKCGETQEFVAKVTCKDCALEEMLRFRTFIQRWNGALRPECHFHGKAAVIFFDLVSTDVDSTIPAETLEERLGDIWDKQWFQSSPTELEEKRMFLEKALTRVAKTLAALNEHKPLHNGDLETSVNPPATHLDALEQEGFVWGLSSCAMKARQVAARRVRRMARLAVVHGDIHLRNVLIRGESEVHLIDYAASGPGHPAVDLVRLELALYLGPVRQFEDDKTSVAFQKALSVDQATIDCLSKRFPDFFECHVNAACAVGMTNTRDAAITVLQKHRGGHRDYLATKFLVAWQHLGIIGSQTALARAVILATADEIAGW